MSGLRLVHLPLALGPFRRWAAERDDGWTNERDRQGRLRGVAFDEGRALHHLLSETFGKGHLQPFRLFVAPGRTNAALYGYSLVEDEELRQNARESAMPEALAICDPARLTAKVMPETWKEGRRLAFDVRVRPVRRLMKAGGAFSKGAEVDAFVVEAVRRFPAGPSAEESMANSGRDREAVYREWLAERLDGAARLERVRLASFSRHRAARGGHVAEGPDATLHGELVIGDPARFAERLARGVGRHTAYGFGMLLLRPAGRR
jgi:CRISPR system Cascade subunit CasE